MSRSETRSSIFRRLPCMTRYIYAGDKNYELFYTDEKVQYRITIYNFQTAATPALR